MKLSFRKALKANNKYSNLSLVALLMVLFVITSCDSDDVGENYYTFTSEMMGGYLNDRPDEYSEFAHMLDTTGVLGLLNAYGKYTCFAPTNDAMYEFYESLGRTSLEEFPYDTIVKIVYDHIIKDAVLTREDFIDGRLNQLTMSKRYISISFDDFTDSTNVIRVNQTAPIVDDEIEVHNGVIHVIGEVLKPTELSLVESIGNDPKFSLFYEALMATKLFEKLNKTEDLTYSPFDYEDDYALANTWRLGTYIQLPEYKKFGYTALLESDSLYKQRNIESLDDLKAYAASVYDDIYPEDAWITDITNPKNSLNRFVAYHLVNKQIGYTKFIIDLDTYHALPNYDLYEYIETMCPNTLLEVRTLRNSNSFNIFNYIDETGKYITITDNYDNDAINGVYHEIDDILVYSKEVASEINSKRLRIDAAAFFPEFTNNDIRGRTHENKLRFILPPGYIDRLEMSEGTGFYYLTNDNRLADYMGDEIWLIGLYDFTITTPSIPAGTYEIRMGYQPTDARGAAQLYWDGIPCGIPLDLRINASDPQVGYETPGTNPSDPDGFENDKMMRNRGYMKGPASFRSNGEWYPDSRVNARLSSYVLRRILGIYTFDEAGTHEFKVKAARQGQFMLDYLEFVPVEYLEQEGID